MEQIVQGITGKIEGKKLTLEVDLSGPGTISQSGKSMVIATTRGNVPVLKSGLTLGFNLYKKN